MSIKPYERQIIGNHFLHNGKVVADDPCKRIEQLVEDYLKYIKTDETGWDKLYREPNKGRYWEKVHLQSSGHGGGPPSLVYLTNEDALLKYKLP